MSNDGMSNQIRMTKTEGRFAVTNRFCSFGIRILSLIRHSALVLSHSYLIVALFTTAAAAQEIVLYTSVDEPVAKPIIRDFECASGLKVSMRTDTEATKSVGLAARLEAEKDNPQADVWWGNEVFRTINLADRGVLAAYESPAAGAIPARYKDPQHRWAGTALRVRVIARSTAGRGGGATTGINSILDLAKPELKGKICMAMPVAGTTSGHVAALYALWGRDKADAYFRDLRANGIKYVGGNSVVAEMVGQGVMWAGVTDNDDVDSMIGEGGKLEAILPDQGKDGIGTLTMPCTVSLVSGAKHADGAKKLVDHLLTKQVEAKLLAAKFAKFSVFDDPAKRGVKEMDVDYRKVAENMPLARRAMEK